MKFFRSEQKPRKVPTHEIIDHPPGPLINPNREPLEKGIERLDQAMDHLPYSEPEKAQADATIEQIKIGLNKILDKVKTDDAMAENCLEDIALFVQNLRKKYPNADNNVFLHAVSGSTVKFSPDLVYKDFPGEDSVLGFVKKLAKKYL